MKIIQKFDLHDIIKTEVVMRFFFYKIVFCKHLLVTRLLVKLSAILKVILVAI